MLAMEHQSKLIKVLKNQIFIIGCKHIICLLASGPVQTRGQGNNGGGASGWGWGDILVAQAT